MITQFERINQPRVEKILKMLDTIETSAKSNRATDDLAALLSPVSARLTGNLETGATPPTPAAATTTPTGKSHWSDVVEMARTAPLQDALAAMLVIATRAEQEVFEHMQAVDALRPRRNTN